MDDPAISLFEFRQILWTWVRLVEMAGGCCTKWVQVLILLWVCINVGYDGDGDGDGDVSSNIGIFCMHGIPYVLWFGDVKRDSSKHREI